MDFVGVWTITGKRGFESVNMKVNTWIGNAIDAAGVFPSVMYTLVDDSLDYDLYAGLDKLDPKSTLDGGMSYFYDNLTMETPDFSTFDYGTIESLGCNDSTDIWMSDSGVTGLFMIPFRSI